MKNISKAILFVFFVCSTMNVFSLSVREDASLGNQEWCQRERNDFVEKGLHIDAIIGEGATILGWAECIDTMKWLIRNGANINHQDFEGNTSLKRAIRERQKYKVEFLLKNEANPNIRDNHGMHPVLAALIYDAREHQVFDQKKSADVYDGKLFRLFDNIESKEIVDLLFEYGADLGYPGKQGYDAVPYAVVDFFIEENRYHLQDELGVDARDLDVLNEVIDAIKEISKQMIKEQEASEQDPKKEEL